MNNNQHNIFRLSAVLYKDEQYTAKKDTILRKIIESIFIEINKDISVLEAVCYCGDNYSLTLEEDEIITIIKKNPKVFAIKYQGDNDITFKLTEKRFQTVSKYSSLGIDEYIIRFINKKLLDKKDEEVKECIYRFLYDIFTSNLNAYDYFINKAQRGEQIAIDNSKYSEDEKKIINAFLSFEDGDKDKAIFNLVSLSLEYCMLTGNENGVYAQGITNKEFYLDTNILYRAIGINGEERKQLTCRFLNKCLENKIKLKVTIYTEEEFKKSLEFYIRLIKQYQGAYTNPGLYKQYNKGKDIYIRYCEWICGRHDTAPDRFKAYLKAEYSQFLNSFKIEVDYLDKLDLEDKKVAKEIEVISASIGAFKEGSYEASDDADAKNLLLLRKKRERRRPLDIDSIMEIKEFFISTDQKLRLWEHYYSNKGQPVTFLPTQWLSIILRFGSRTTDDYRSFISFLNMRNNQSQISPEKLSIILDSISELTHDISIQTCLAKEIIEERVIDVIKEDDDTLAEEVRRLTKKTMDELLSTANKETATALKENLLISEENITLKENLDEKVYELNEKVNKVEELEGKIKEIYINTEINRWRKKNLIINISLIIIVVLYWILHIVAVDSTYNVVTKLYKWAEKKKQYESVIELLGGALNLSVGFVAIKKVALIYIKSSEVYKNKVSSIIKEFEKCNNL